MAKPRDKYDEAITYFEHLPHDIQRAWGLRTHKHHCLFQAVGSPANCGCLVEIRGDDGRACTDELTEEIRKDKRIPDRDGDITVAHLPVFAEWQRRLDKELGR